MSVREPCSRGPRGRRAPGEITDDYWIWVDGPQPGPDEDDPYGGGGTGPPGLIPPIIQLDDWWDKIWPAVKQGDLGFRAKAATARENGLQVSDSTKIICVYTRDWRDKDDVRRVLIGLCHLAPVVQD